MRIKYRVGVMPGPWPTGAAGRDFFWRFVELWPSGRTAEVVSVWVVRAGEGIPRFVTAYPGGGR